MASGRSNLPEVVEKHRLVRQLRSEGLTYKQIGEKLGINDQWVGCICRRDPAEPGGIAVRHKQVIDLFDQGYSGPEVARMMGYEVNTVYIIKSRYRRTKPYMSQSERAQRNVRIRQRRADGLSYRALAEEFGLCEATIMRIVQQRPPEYGGKAAIWKKAQEMYEQGAAPKAIAAELGVDRSAIYRHVKIEGRRK